MDGTSPAPTVVRTCGTPGDTCTACCKTHYVNQPLGKGSDTTLAGKWCSYCTIGTGCTDYNGRVAACVDYFCLYLLGEDDMRPDRSGIVADWYPSDDETVRVIRLMEYRPGAFREPVFDRYLELGKRLNCFVLTIVPKPFGGGRKEYFPPTPGALVPEVILKLFAEQPDTYLD